MPLQKSRSKSKDKKKDDKKDKKDDKKVVKKTSVKTASKGGNVSQVAKQSVVVNVGADGAVKKRRGRPRGKKSAPAPQQKPPQFSVPQSGLVQQVFQPPLPAQNMTQPQPQNFTRTNPLAPTNAVSSATQTLNQAVARRLTASTENPLLSSSEFVSTGLLPPPVSSRVAPLAPPSSPRATTGFSEQQLDFMERIKSMYEDTPLRKFRKRLKDRLPASIEDIDEDIDEIISDRDATAFERINGIRSLDDIRREYERLPKQKEIPAEPIRSRTPTDEVLRSRPSSTLGKKPTDRDFVFDVPNIADRPIPPPRDLMADVFNPPESQVSIIKPKKKLKLKMKDTETPREMGDSPIPKPSEIPDVMDDVARQELPPTEERDFTHAVGFSLPSPSDPMKIKYIFNVKKEAKDLMAYIRSGEPPSQSGQFDLRGRRIGSIDTYQRRRTPSASRGRSPMSRSEMTSPERTAQEQVMGLLSSADEDRPELQPVKNNLLAYVDKDQLQQIRDIMKEPRVETERRPNPFPLEVAPEMPMGFM